MKKDAYLIILCLALVFFINSISYGQEEAAEQRFKISIENWMADGDYYEKGSLAGSEYYFRWPLDVNLVTYKLSYQLPKFGTSLEASYAFNDISKSTTGTIDDFGSVAAIEVGGSGHVKIYTIDVIQRLFTLPIGRFNLNLDGSLGFLNYDEHVMVFVPAGTDPFLEFWRRNKGLRLGLASNLPLEIKIQDTIIPLAFKTNFYYAPNLSMGCGGKDYAWVGDEGISFSSNSGRYTESVVGLEAEIFPNWTLGISHRYMQFKMRKTVEHNDSALPGMAVDKTRTTFKGINFTVTYRF